jgi:hypothetical protein
MRCAEIDIFAAIDVVDFRPLTVGDVEGAVAEGVAEADG